jgi:uncharacterized protein (DUF302 family)
MKKHSLTFLLFLTNIFFIHAQTLKPYTIGAETTGTVTQVSSQVKSALKGNGIEVVGEYTPAADKSRRVVAITSSDLQSAVKSVGGLTGFAVVLRVGVTEDENKVIVSYTTPEYWGNAYFQDQYPKVAAYYDALSKKLASALNPLGENGGATFGSEKGEEIEKLRKYRYMMGMPNFTNNHELKEFASYEDAVSLMDGRLAKGVAKLEKVYAVELKDENIKLYGIGISGEDGEAKFLPKIDVSNPKHTAFLPYEILVLDNKVYMLHGRFRIALSFPDLKMGQFMKIVSTPKDIKRLLSTLTE